MGLIERGQAIEPVLDGFCLSKIRQCCLSFCRRLAGYMPGDPLIFQKIYNNDDTFLADTFTSLDLRGLKCPLPALRTRKALRGLADGDHLDVACTDPLSVIDIPHLLRQTGDILEGMEETDNVVTFHIKRVKKADEQSQANKLK